MYRLNGIIFPSDPEKMKKIILLPTSPFNPQQSLVVRVSYPCTSLKFKLIYNWLIYYLLFILGED